MSDILRTANAGCNDTYNVVLSSLPSVKRILVARDDDHVIRLPFSAS